MALSQVVIGIHPLRVKRDSMRTDCQSIILMIWNVGYACSIQDEVYRIYPPAVRQTARVANRDPAAGSMGRSTVNITSLLSLLRYTGKLTVEAVGVVSADSSTCTQRICDGFRRTVSPLFKVNRSDVQLAPSKMSPDKVEVNKETMQVDGHGYIPSTINAPGSFTRSMSNCRRNVSKLHFLR